MTREMQSLVDELDTFFPGCGTAAHRWMRAVAHNYDTGTELGEGAAVTLGLFDGTDIPDVVFDIAELLVQASGVSR